jgi:hypothetical protein
MTHPVSNMISNLLNDPYLVFNLDNGTVVYGQFESKDENGVYLSHTTIGRYKNKKGQIFFNPEEDKLKEDSDLIGIPFDKISLVYTRRIY